MKYGSRSKHWLQSKTIWVNSLAAGVAVLEANTHLLQPLLSVNVYAVLAVVLPVANVMLRTVTAQGLHK